MLSELIGQDVCGDVEVPLVSLLPRICRTEQPELCSSSS